MKYRTTEKAGVFVAGVRNPGKGKPIELTEEQARYPLISGEIELPSKTTVKSEAKAGTETVADKKAD
ncbi:hypothetical protein [Breoghania sp.]|uniref:hypothetical protein n=1 Tax=Breoghania sp. TaxID=2065378 RepID=UPI0029CA0703|nr:hypothetical protein [Breoghania sp.]